MAVTPSGILAEPLLEIQRMLSEVSAFQDFVGESGDAAAALLRIHLIGVKESDITYPFAVVGPGPWQRPVNAGGASDQFSAGGENLIYFEAKVSAVNKDSEADAYFEFTNPIGDIIDGFENLSGAGGNLSFKLIETPDNAHRKSEREEVADEDRYSIRFVLTWGID